MERFPLGHRHALPCPVFRGQETERGDSARRPDVSLEVRLEVEPGETGDHDARPVDADAVAEVFAGIEGERLDKGGERGIGGPHGGYAGLLAVPSDLGIGKAVCQTWTSVSRSVRKSIYSPQV
jgi:hypothetical protein